MDRLWRKQDSLLKFQRRIWFTLFDEQKPPPDVLEALKKRRRTSRDGRQRPGHQLRARHAARPLAGFESREEARLEAVLHARQPKATSTINGEVDDAAFAYALESVNRARLVTAETKKATPNQKREGRGRDRGPRREEADPKKGAACEADVPEKRSSSRGREEARRRHGHPQVLHRRHVAADDLRRRFAGYNWSAAAALEEQVTRDERTCATS